jgi:aryl-alcohol dehydrogenase-like predicted oxidoreductase
LALQVTAIGAGLMSLGGAYGPGGSDEERFAYLDKLYEMCETFWDNADIYGDAEDLVGIWFTRTGKRKEIFLTSKFGFFDVTTGAMSSKGDYAKEAIEKNLKRRKVSSRIGERLFGRMPELE